MADAGSEPEVPRDRYSSPVYRGYALSVFMLVFLCHAMDRRMPSIIVEPVKKEFGLSDTQLGLFGGLGYGIAFAIAVLPIGYFADRTNRRNLLAFLTAGWSLCTALGGVVGNYAQLVATRLGVGASEAGGVPITMPLLADIFPPQRRALVFGFLYTAGNIGQVIATVVGAFIAAKHGWRAAMLIAGIPGLIAALLMFISVKEPRRGGAEEGGAAPVVPAPPFGEVLRLLVKKPELPCLIATHTLMGLVTISVTAWISSFFIRVHHISLTETGLILGVAGAVGGALAPMLYGWLGARLEPRDKAWPLRMVWLTSAVSLVSSLAMLYSPALLVAVALFVLGELVRNGYPPLIYSALTTNTPPHMRGSLMSVTQMVVNLSGYGLGPIMVGLLSDYYGGGTAIRYALAIALMLYVPAIVFTLIASRRLNGSPRERRAAATAAKIS